MGIGASMRTVARSQINKFGNTATLYSYSSATKSTSDEGDVTVSSWGSGTSIKLVPSEEFQQMLNYGMQGIDSEGGLSFIARDDASFALNDRINIGSVNYRVMRIEPVRIEDVVVAYNITSARFEV